MLAPGLCEPRGEEGRAGGDPRRGGAGRRHAVAPRHGATPGMWTGWQQIHYMQQWWTLLVFSAAGRGDDKTTAGCCPAFTSPALARAVPSGTAWPERDGMARRAGLGQLPRPPIVRDRMQLVISGIKTGGQWCVAWKASTLASQFQ